MELERAKKAAISVISNALESKATSSEDIGRQFLTYGHRWGGRGGRVGKGDEEGCSKMRGRVHGMKCMEVEWV